MKRVQSLPIIPEKKNIKSSKKKSEVPCDSTFTNETSINFALLKKTMQASKFTKSSSTQDLFKTKRPSIPKTQSTNFLFNENYLLEKNIEYEKTKTNFLFEEALYKKDYISRYKKIKTNLSKRQFNKELKKLEEDKEKINDNNIEEKDENKIDINQYMWESKINLNNDKNYDIGDNEAESNEEINTESNNLNTQEINDLDSNKQTINRTSLYLTEMKNFKSNETLFSTIFKNSSNRYMNNYKNDYNIKKIKKIGKEKNPFNFTRYVASDNIPHFHKVYRDFKSLCRKHYINEKSASFAFIKECEKEKIVCNPLGLIKRKGEENILEMNNQHSGDKFINCLSTGLKFVNHLNSLEMSNNRLTHHGIKKLLSNIKQNESLLKNIIKLNLSYNNIGDEGIEDLITFIEDKNCKLENLDIEGNNLGDKNINKICISIAQSIYTKLTYFNIGKNKISKNSEKGLLFLIEKCSELVVFILRNNQIDNYLGAKLMISLKNLLSLKVFDISWNLIGDHLVYSFLYEEAVNYFPNQNNLYNNFELDKIKKNMKINFNKNPLLPKLDKNTSAKKKNNEIIIMPEIKNIKVPERKPSIFAIELSNYIKNNLCPLIHLNISHNNLPYEDCKLISEESKANRSILGFHVDGNEMHIDPSGFIHPLDKEKKSHNYYSKSQISFDIEKIKNLPKLLNSPINDMRIGKNCWICQCWREVEFVLDIKIEDIKPKYMIVKIHFDFENFVPCDMFYKKKCFRLIRMCPPGKVKFFFTIDGNPVKNCYNEYDYKIKDFEKPIKYTFDVKFLEQYNNIKSMILNSTNQKDKINTIDQNNISIQEDIRDNEDKLISKVIYVQNYGIRNILPNNNVITNDYQSTLKYSTPRPEDLSSRIRNQIPWQFVDSIWSCCNYYYEGETDESIEKIFEFDFNRSEYDLIFIKENDFLSAKDLMKDNYRNILDCYIDLSSYSGTNLWQISYNTLVDWLNEKCEFFDSKYSEKYMIQIIEAIYFNKIDMEDRTKYNNFPSNKYNLIRHSFLSLLINISIDKYINVLREVSNPFEALKISMENNIISGIEGYNHQSWRKERYYNEEIDNYIKAFLPLLDGLYHTFSKSEKEKIVEENIVEENEVVNENDNKNEEERIKTEDNNNDNIDTVKMTLEDFNEFTLTFVDTIDYQINKTPLIFHISKKLQIDEITNNDFLYLNLIEFCEALCRVIDIYSPMPPEEKMDDWPSERRKGQLLIEKLENIMPQLYKKIDHPKFNLVRDKFKYPLKDQITSLYIVDYKNNMFYNGYENYFIKDNNIIIS